MALLNGPLNVHEGSFVSNFNIVSRWSGGWSGTAADDGDCYLDHIGFRSLKRRLLRVV